MASDATYEKIRSFTEASIEAVFTDPTYGKVCAKKAVLCGIVIISFRFYSYDHLCLFSLNGEKRWIILHRI